MSSEAKHLNVDPNDSAFRSVSSEMLHFIQHDGLFMADLVTLSPCHLFTRQHLPCQLIAVAPGLA